MILGNLGIKIEVRILIIDFVFLFSAYSFSLDFSLFYMRPSLFTILIFFRLLQIQNRTFMKIGFERSKQINDSSQSSYCSVHNSSSLVILCQSRDDPEIAETLCQFMRASLEYFINNFGRYEKFGHKEDAHKLRLAHLLVSCREFIQQRNCLGTCAFGLCYVMANSLFCLKSQGIEMFVLDQGNTVIEPINGCCELTQTKRNRTKRIENYYFSHKMPHIKAEHIFQQNQCSRNKVSFQQIPFSSFLQGGKPTNIKILLGCSETFDLISSNTIFKHFQQSSKSDVEKTHDILEQAKRNINIVQRRDLSLVCWRVTGLSQNMEMEKETGKQNLK